jgi:hypothetical protein
MLYYRLYKRMRKWVRGLGPSEIGLAAPDIIFLIVIPMTLAGIVGSILESYWNARQGTLVLVTILIVAAAGTYIRVCRKFDED